MRIGELADAVGVSTRAIRHYHRIGLLPEPERRANGYRLYGARDLLRLARVRRLVELGLSLDEVADVLSDDEGREFLEILGELDADLARQEADIRRRRTRLAELRQRAAGRPLDADDAVSEPTAQLLATIARSFPDSVTARRDREFLALLDSTAPDSPVVEQLRRALDDPQSLTATAELYRRFDELADVPVDDPRVDGLARDLVAVVPPELAAGVTAGLPDDVDEHPFAAAFLADLLPAQAEVVRRMFQIIEADR